MSATLYNCRTDYAPICKGEFVSLLLGGCIMESKDTDDSFTMGGQPADAAEFFTVYGIKADGEAEAVTDIKEPRKALSVAGSLGLIHELPVTLSPAL